MELKLKSNGVEIGVKWTWDQSETKLVVWSCIDFGLGDNVDFSFQAQGNIDIAFEHDLNAGKDMRVGVDRSVWIEVEHHVDIESKQKMLGLRSMQTEGGALSWKECCIERINEREMINNWVDA